MDDELRHYDEQVNLTHKRADDIVFERAFRLLEGEDSGLLTTNSHAINVGRSNNILGAGAGGPSRPSSHGFKRWGSEAARKALAEMPASEGGFADEAVMRSRPAPAEPTATAEQQQEKPPQNDHVPPRRSLFDVLRNKTPNEQSSADSNSERF